MDLGQALNPMPWWVGLIAMAVSGVGGHLATRMTSKDKAQSNLVEQTVERQRQLDERQNQMMDDFCSDIDRLRAELLQVRTELSAEREHNRVLSNEMDAIKEENRKLRRENNILQTQVTELKLELKKVQHNERARSIREEGCSC